MERPRRDQFAENRLGDGAQDRLGVLAGEEVAARIVDGVADRRQEFDQVAVAGQHQRFVGLPGDPLGVGARPRQSAVAGLAAGLAEFVLFVPGQF